jgi:hypothetical protein
MTILYGACPRCTGPVFDTWDGYVYVWTCLTCGWARYAERSVKPVCRSGRKPKPLAEQGRPMEVA